MSHPSHAALLYMYYSLLSSTCNTTNSSMEALTEYILDLDIQGNHHSFVTRLIYLPAREMA